MSIMPRLASLRDLCSAASLPAAAVSWLEKPLAPTDLTVTTIKKRRGGYRVVRQPVDESLVRLQKRLKEFLDTKVLDPHPAVHGFTRGRSTYTNATAHLHAKAILTIDIQSFFDSISRDQVAQTLEAHGATTVIADAIANVATFNNRLVTGFSTSPVLSNLVFRPVDILLDEYALNNQLTYTRYADDLNFSGETVSNEALEAIGTLLTTFGFQVNSDKVKFQRRGHRQMVTGYTIDHLDHVRLPRAAKRRLRQDLHYVETIGLTAQARIRNIDEDSFREGLLGKINYLMSCERESALRMRTKLINQL